MTTLDEAIKDYDNEAKFYETGANMAKDPELKGRYQDKFVKYAQLVRWLRELKGYREEEAYRADMSMQEWLDKRGDLEC